MMLITEVSNKPVQIVILGSSKSGKSAVTVRYLTKRFIGEYISSKDFLYHQTLNMRNGSVIEVEILDTSDSNNNQYLNDHIKWGEAFVIVYSICNLNSFIYAKKMIETIFHVKNLLYTNVISSNISNNLSNQDINASNNNDNFLMNKKNLYKNHDNFQQFKFSSKSNKDINNGFFSIILLGNKRDLEHIRQVMVEDGQEFALKFQCQFYEVSAAESFAGVCLAFQSLIREIRPLLNFQLNNLINIKSNINKNSSKLYETTKLKINSLNEVCCYDYLENHKLVQSLNKKKMFKPDYSNKLSSSICGSSCSSKSSNSSLKTNNLHQTNNRSKTSTSLTVSKMIGIFFGSKLNKQKKHPSLSI